MIFILIITFINTNMRNITLPDTMPNNTNNFPYTVFIYLRIFNKVWSTEVYHIMDMKWCKHLVIGWENVSFEIYIDPMMESLGRHWNILC